ncbi:PDR/VanB family oxidoreductase [Amycolatopsis rhabdoformis]|uniref:PDR/VanB family oxidoreductase n=1 Tax=Amycolatopsis rhabdoformis TaxID=1448059 RepID=A0ABZ1IJ22_9PSEU|nr:PDR/VanB family oxidoreductase [Amycolatopsis rhabdoformis]WSE33683.1 PDR/VanB family oxidoreductase [Amycolatopsis rhabdoformis]
MTARAGEDLELDLVVAHRRTVAQGVVELRLRDARGEPLPRWSPGAHVDLHLGDGSRRQYSLCGDPRERGTWRIAVLREDGGRGGSRWVHEHLAAGARLRAVGPRNRFVFEPAEEYLFVGGGIGITPLLPMIDAAHREQARWQLVYGGRSRATMAFAGELADRYGDRVRLVPEDELGRLDVTSVLPEPDERTLVYCCGPAGLLTALTDHGRTRGWDGADLRVERFTAAAASGPDRAFVVELARSGRRITVGAGESVLAAIRRAGVEVASSCEQGTCGTCTTRVRTGSVEHRDTVLDEQERATSMTLCVSRAAEGALVLDL